MWPKAPKDWAVPLIRTPEFVESLRALACTDVADYIHRPHRNDVDRVSATTLGTPATRQYKLRVGRVEGLAIKRTVRWSDLPDADRQDTGPM